MTFTGNDYDVVRDEIRRSAAALVPRLYDWFAPRTVIDVGCGEGWWASEFQRLGCDVLGVDGHDGANAVIPYRQADLAQPLVDDEGTFHAWDMAVCLEVAEHLPADRAASFVADLFSMAEVVVFSAAVPGQGGIGHVNEQWPAYWTELFNRVGYSVSGALRWEVWDDDRIAPYYRANLLLAVPQDRAREPLFARWFAGSAADPIGVVHPLTFAHVAAARRRR